jgi:hypothetical protein
MPPDHSGAAPAPLTPLLDRLDEVSPENESGRQTAHPGARENRSRVVPEKSPGEQKPHLPDVPLPG